MLIVFILVLLCQCLVISSNDGQFLYSSSGFKDLSSSSSLSSYEANNGVDDKFLNNMLTLKTGTTIVGICCIDGIVLGADTRSTGGPLVMDKNKLKIHNIASHIYCCGAGTSAHCDYVTRKAKHELGLYSIDRELAGEQTLDPVSSALRSIIKSINNAKASLQSVFILGGVDDNEIALYQIDDDGTSLRLGFAALGSGSTDAIAILETQREIWNNRTELVTNRNDKYMENINTDEAIASVRKAVQAGILNDLGSGSHVDLLVIQKDKVRGWREKLVSSWEKDKEIESQTNLNETNTDNIDDNYIDRGKIVYRKSDINDTIDAIGIDVELLSF
jgi:20S proteasome subunit beta 2